MTTFLHYFNLLLLRCVNSVQLEHNFPTSSRVECIGVEMKVVIFLVFLIFFINGYRFYKIKQDMSYVFSYYLQKKKFWQKITNNLYHRQNKNFV